jgi:hypothetical protein
MTILVFGLLESSWATSIAFHLRSGSEIPWVTVRWKSATRNVLVDYTKLFESKPGNVRAVGIESHSEDANHKSETLFGALSFTRAQ